MGRDAGRFWRYQFCSAFSTLHGFFLVFLLRTADKHNGAIFAGMLSPRVVGLRVCVCVFELCSAKPKKKNPHASGTVTHIHSTCRHFLSSGSGGSLSTGG